MSQLAYQRFMASYMLTAEEQLPQNRQEMIDYTEDVLQSKGIECDKRIAELPQEQMQEILDEARKLRARGKKKKKQEQQQKEEEEQKEEEKEVTVNK